MLDIIEMATKYCSRKPLYLTYLMLSHLQLKIDLLLRIKNKKLLESGCTEELNKPAHFCNHSHVPSNSQGSYITFKEVLLHAPIT